MIAGILNLSDFKGKTQAAITTCWDHAETGNLDGFGLLLTDLIRDNGLEDARIIWGSCDEASLPGYYAPTITWDLLVLRNERLIAAVKLNIRLASSDLCMDDVADKAVWSAKNLWAAWRSGTFGDSSRPFVGWLTLVEDSPETAGPFRDRSEHFAVRPEFQGASYIERYNLLCKKLVQEQLYTSTAVLTSQRTAAKTGKFSDVSEMTSLKNFVTSFAGHIAAEAAR